MRSVMINGFWYESAIKPGMTSPVNGYRPSRAPNNALPTRITVAPNMLAVS